MLQEDMLDNMPNSVLDRLLDTLPDRMPEDMLDRMIDNMPEKMPEDMPDRMPGRCQVGIIRSKIISFFVI